MLSREQVIGDGKFVLTSTRALIWCNTFVPTREMRAAVEGYAASVWENGLHDSDFIWKDLVDHDRTHPSPYEPGRLPIVPILKVVGVRWCRQENVSA